ncbi:hypothetical protein J5N97_017489 [Dioscorea zingiberensis]|uniref:Uncharacterized protein n=1 Tax=Dioscorea zingiberensis TaxID=325984 RepID=A0A9D5CM47_9LILI|nr:hypothetical protein J5N97_017489 [Dioscorea zingiberensis]
MIIPCVIGDGIEENALADSGASNNVMPYKLFMKLGLGEPKATKMTLQLSNHSGKRPQGVAENILVSVDKFVFPTNFILLDVDDDVEVSIILGRPFLATAIALHDHHEGMMSLRVGDSEDYIHEIFLIDPLRENLGELDGDPLIVEGDSATAGEKGTPRKIERKKGKASA